jgi:hypothetical protein
MMRPLLTPDLVSSLAHAVPRRAQVVWFCLWAHADRDSGEAWPSADTIAAEVCTNRNHVHEDVSALRAAGWLVIIRSGNSNRYRLLDPTATECNQDRTSDRVECNRDGTSNVTGTGPTVYPGQDPNTTKNTTKIKKPRCAKGNASDFEPRSMDLPYESDRFRKTWGDFCDHRETIKVPLTLIAASRVLAKCRQWGEEEAIQAMDNTIESGKWTGIFRPRSNGQADSRQFGPGTVRSAAPDTPFANVPPRRSGNTP